MDIQRFTARQQFWLDHLALAKSAGLSVRAYARREGLGEGSLYAAQRLLSDTAARSRPSLYAARRKGSVAAPSTKAFAAVRVSGAIGCELSLPGSVTLRLPEAPSATWLATFLRELAS